MFKIGRKYKIKMWEPGPERDSLIEHYNCEITAIELPLIKIRQFDKERIINVTSHAFVSAEVQPD